MTKEGLTFEGVKGEWGEFTEVIVFWNGQEIGRGVRDIDENGHYCYVLNEKLQNRLIGNNTSFLIGEFEKKVIELYRG